MIFTNIQKVKNRVISIVEEVFSQFNQQQQQQFGLDQSKLEELCDLLKLSILAKQRVAKPARKLKFGGNEIKEKLIKLPQIRKQKQQNAFSQFQSTKLLQISNDSLAIIHEPNFKLNQFSTSKTQALFQSKTLKRFCSISQISKTKFLIAGGCDFQDQSNKSENIYIFELQTLDFIKVGNLLEPLSSHTSIFVSNRVYFIGGKKGNGMITKMCSYYDIFQKEVGEIAALNFCAACCCLTSWKGQYIYKIGGLGQCFGQWSLSPYIERYCIKGDFWEVINPTVSDNYLTRFSEFQLYAYSLSYITSRDQLVVFGGFDSNRKGTNFGFVMQIKDQKQIQKLQQEQSSNIHEIISKQTLQSDFGVIEGLQSGGFWQSELIVANQTFGSMAALQTFTSPHLQIKPVQINTYSN